MSRRHKSHQHIPSMTYSDFEVDSDALYASDAPAPPPTRTDAELNFSVLQRYNPSILSIAHTSPYAVVYTFSAASGTWEKLGIEGSSFLVRLAPSDTHAERYAVMVLNRRGLANFELELMSADEVEVAAEYIILQQGGQHQQGQVGEEAAEGVVFGLWIFQEPSPASTAHEREEMARKIVECARRVEAGRYSPNAEDTGYEGEAEEGDGSVELDAEGRFAEEENRRRGIAKIFEQQRRADDSWSVRSHSPKRPLLPQQQEQDLLEPQPQYGIQTAAFTRSVDTDFFLSAKPKAMTPSPAISAQSIQDPVPHNLLDLFRKAGNEYANK